MARCGLVWLGLAMRVAIIPARGQSRRIPRKNIRPFHGKPIIAYSIEAAKASGLFDKVIVSTDDWEIGGLVLQRYNVAVQMREPEMARDEVGTQEVMRYALGFVVPTADYACCIYPCAPLMTALDLLFLYEQLIRHEYRYTWIEGWAYWGKAADFIANSELQSGKWACWKTHKWIDINTEDDFERAERMYAELHPEAVAG